MKSSSVSLCMLAAPLSLPTLLWPSLLLYPMTLAATAVSTGQPLSIVSVFALEFFPTSLMVVALLPVAVVVEVVAISEARLTDPLILRLNLDIIYLRR